MPDPFPLQPIARSKSRPIDPVYRTNVPIPKLRRRGLRDRKKADRKQDVSDDDQLSSNKHDVKDILLEATDTRNGGIYYFILWNGYDDHAGSWVRHSDLNHQLKTWWESERFCRFPLVEYCTIRPQMYISSRPLPELIIDDSSSASDHVDNIDPRIDDISQSSSESSFDEKDSFEVEAIVAERVVSGKKEFRVKWLGYSLRDASWVDQANVNSVAKRIWNNNKK